MNEENLIQNSERTPSELRENAKKAGIESGKVRRRKKLMKETLESFLSSGIKDERVIESLVEMGFDKEDINNQTLILAGLFQKAKSGDVKAFEAIRDTLGEKPAEKIECESTVIYDDIPKKSVKGE